MSNHLLSNLSHVELSADDCALFQLNTSTLTLKRSWPRSTDHIGLEFVSDHGDVIPGQWYADGARLAHVAAATHQSAPNATSALVQMGDTTVLLQTQGADRTLKGLANLLAQPDATLFVHRPERRAVVRLRSGDETTYAKVVRPERVVSLLTNSAALEQLPRRAFVIPKLLIATPSTGVTIWSELPGTSLHDLPISDMYLTAIIKAGAALRNLHDFPLPAGVSEHTAADEVAVLQNWLRMLAIFLPHLAEDVKQTAETIISSLLASQTSPCLLHRDFYDKQIFYAASGTVGLLDFDTLTSGEPALDLANALAHFELRALLGELPLAQAQAACSAMLEGYRPNAAVRSRLPAYLASSVLRLFCVYAFRPQTWSRLPALRALLGQHVEGGVIPRDWALNVN